MNDKNLTVHFGRIGTAGQAQEKTFPTAEAAKKEHDKLIAEKTKKGYVEVSAGAASAATPVPVVKKAAEAKPRVAPDAVAAPVSVSRIWAPVLSSARSWVLPASTVSKESDQSRAATKARLVA